MSKSQIFIGLSISFAIGVFIASIWQVDPRAVLSAVAVLATLVIMLYVFDSTVGAVYALFLLFIVLGALRLQTAQTPNEFNQIVGQKQKLEGVIVEDIDIRPDRQLITFRPFGRAQNLLLTTTKSQAFFYGDKLAVEGKITSAKEFNDFDYPKYLERFNIYGLSYYPKILILKSHQGSWLKEKLLKIKWAFVGRLNQFYKEPENSLLLGILIGAKKTLPPEIVDNFNTTGTSHIIAVSGYNVTILISALACLAWIFGRRAWFYLGMCTVAAFVIIAGASASVVRAGVMCALALWALNSGRQYAVSPSLFCAAFIMLLINPKILFWDAGFQLSFAATAGIVYFYPLLSIHFENFGEWFGIKTVLLTTLSAIAATLPLILFTFGRLSLVAPIVNMLVLPLIPATMLFGFLSILPFAGPGLALVASLLLKYILFITRFFARLPFSSLDFKISLWLFWLMVLAEFALFFALKLTAKKSGESLPLTGLNR